MRDRATQSLDVGGRSKQLNIRIEPELYEQCETFAAKLRAQTGLDVSVSSAIRRLVQLGLERAAELEAPSSPPAKSRRR